MILRSDIIKSARKYVGVPFSHQGRGMSGMDCIGLIWNVGRDVGINFDMPNAYSETPKGERVLEGTNKVLVQPQRQGFHTLIPGDIFITWGSQKGIAQHFAIVAEFGGRKTMIHAFTKARKIVEHGLVPQFWFDRYMGTWCFPDTERLEG